jgi:hypothetical protein
MTAGKNAQDRALAGAVERHQRAARDITNALEARGEPPAGGARLSHQLPPSAEWPCAQRMGRRRGRPEKASWAVKPGLPVGSRWPTLLEVI